MNANADIRYFKRSEIDTAKWDQCVQHAPNGWLYSLSFFLDGIGDWDALVLGDYDYIMPMPKKRKYGIWYIYIPPFTGQLGIIGAAPVSTALTDHFIRAIPKIFFLADLLMNEQNPGCSLPEVVSSRRTNYIIPLHEGYASIYDKYSKDAKKNIRKTISAGLSSFSDITMEKVIKMYTEAYGGKNRNISRIDYKRFKILGERCIERGNGFIMGVRNPDMELLAAAFFGKDEKRIYYILGAPSPQGRIANATHVLIDEVIKKYAGTGMVFDFEGSDIASVSQFYRKFSPITMQYDLVQIDRLPRWLQWLRKKTKSVVKDV